MLPDFVVIGAMKGGTTSLYEYLKQHPDIGMSDMKELNYFVEEQNLVRGRDWYESQFNGAARLHGEASPNYSKYPTFAGVPERMHDLIPNVRLIYILRDPIARIVSHYTHNYIAGRENQRIDEALSGSGGEHYVACSRYFMQIEQFQQYFPSDALLVTTLEDLTRQPVETMERIFEFLGVDDTFAKQIDYRAHWETASRRRRNRFGQYLKVARETLPVTPSLPSPVARLLTRASRDAVEKPTLSPELEAKLVAQLSDDVERLRSYTGESFDCWRF